MKSSRLLWVVFAGLMLLVKTLHADEFDDFNKNRDTTNNYQPIKSMIGVTLGTPAGIQVHAVSYFKTGMGIRVTGGLVPLPGRAIYGFQVNVIKKLGESKNNIHELSLGFGHSQIDRESPNQDLQWSYGGLFYGATLRYFFFETGLTFGSGSYTNPQLNLQLGFNFSKKRFDPSFYE